MKIFGLEVRRAKESPNRLPRDLWERQSAFLRYSPRMTAGQLMANTTVNACVCVIADAVASLSCNVYRKTEAGRVREDSAPLFRLVRREPNPEESAFSFWQKTMANLLLNGNAFIFVERAADGSPSALWPLDPEKVEIRRGGDGNIFYKYRVNGTEYAYKADKILHIPAYSLGGLRGASPLETAGHAAKLGLTLDEYTNDSFDGGIHSKLLIEVPTDEKKFSKDDAQKLKERILDAYGGREKANDPFIVANGMKASALNLASNSDSQLAENRAYSEKEVAKIFRVPLFMLGSENSKFTNMEQANTFFLRHTLSPWLVRIQQRMDRLLTYPYEGCYVEFDADTLVRADFKTRWDNHRLNFQAGLFTLNEIRDMENLPRVQEEYGDKHFGLENYKPLSAASGEGGEEEDGKKKDG